MKNVKLAEPDTKVSEIKTYFEEGEPINAIVVVEGKKPIGLVMNIHLDRTLSQRFGVALYFEKPTRDIMDGFPLVVDSDTSLEEARQIWR